LEERFAATILRKQKENIERRSGEMRTWVLNSAIAISIT